MSDEAEALRQEQANEYGQFVATSSIYHEGALAYAPGYPVPASNVHRYGYEQAGLVKRVQSGSSTRQRTEES